MVFYQGKGQRRTRRLEPGEHIQAGNILRFQCGKHVAEVEVHHLIGLRVCEIEKYLINAGNEDGNQYLGIYRVVNGGNP